jgi:hypothetical protein
MGLHLTLAISDMFTPPPHPVLGFSELTLSLGERFLAVDETPLCPLLKPRSGPAAQVTEHRGRLVIDERRDGAAHPARTAIEVKVGACDA